MNIWLSYSIGIHTLTLILVLIRELAFLKYVKVSNERFELMKEKADRLEVDLMRSKMGSFGKGAL